jgi:hypothetical protein
VCIMLLAVLHCMYNFSFLVPASWWKIRSFLWHDFVAFSPESVEVHLVHGHDWARLVSSQLFNELFTACSPEHLVAANQHNKLGETRRKSGGSRDGKIVEKASNYLTKNLPLKVSLQYQ